MFQKHCNKYYMCYGIMIFLIILMLMYIKFVKTAFKTSSKQN